MSKTTPRLIRVTKVNPTAATAARLGQENSVSIGPHEILQVIMTGDSKAGVWCRACAPRGGIRLQAIRYEQFLTDGYTRRRGNFSLDDCRMGSRQEHYWFRVNPACLESVLELDNVETEIEDLLFMADSVEIGRLKVFLYCGSAEKEQFKRLLKNIAVGGAEQDLIYNEGADSGVVDRNLDEESGYLLNPGTHERFRFEGHQRSMLVEVAPPRMKGGHWKAKLMHPRWTSCLAVEELPSRRINRTVIQRFEVKNFLHAIPAGTCDKVEIGSLQLRACDESNQYFTKFDRNVKFWLVRERTMEQVFDNQDDSGDVEDVPFRPTRMLCLAPPMRTVVRLKDLGRDILDGTKKVKGRLAPVSRVGLSSRTIYNPVSESCYEVGGAVDVLCFTMHKDMTALPPHFQPQLWKVEASDGGLTMNETQDYHSQTFFFRRATENCCKGGYTTVKFSCNGRQKRVYVKAV